LNLQGKLGPDLWFFVQFFHGSQALSIEQTIDFSFDDNPEAIAFAFPKHRRLRLNVKRFMVTRPAFQLKKARGGRLDFA